MKYRFVAMAALATALAVSQANAQQAQGQQTVAVGQSQSGSSSLNYNNFQSGKRSASSAIAPGLFASGLSCSGSAAIGGASGGWGLSLGLTKEDTQCNARENAKAVLGLVGDKLATKEILCDVPSIRAAFARSNRPCLPRGNERVASNSGSRR